MSDEKRKGVIDIASEPAAGSEPAHVSILVDGDRKFTIRTSDLENIGAQLRGKKKGFIGSILLPVGITALTVLLTTGIAQYFQYISWLNTTRLQQTTERVALAKNAYQQASDAISRRYYATGLYLNAVLALNRKDELDDKLRNIDLKFNQKSFDDYNDQMKKWTDSYDQILSDIDFYMDRPVLWNSERASVRDFKDLDCGSKSTLLEEMRRHKLNINSLKVQFAATNYCFHQAMLPFDIEVISALSGKEYYPIPPTEKKAAAQRVEDVRSMSNEFRCFAQHRIALFERDKRRAIFKLSRWISEKFSALFVNPADAARADLKRRLDKAAEECDFTKTIKNRDRFAS